MVKNNFQKAKEAKTYREWGGKVFLWLHAVIMNLKGWLRGIHHHCSARFINGYLDEFFLDLIEEIFTRHMAQVDRAVYDKPTLSLQGQCRLNG